VDGGAALSMRAMGIVMAALLALADSAAAVELRGTVVGASGNEARIRVEGDLLPEVGDSVALSTSVGGIVLPIGTWRVTRVDGDLVIAAKVEGEGVAAVDQQARISVANPRPRAAAEAPRGLAQGGAAPPRGAPGPSAPGLMAPGSTAPSGPPTPLPVDVTRRVFPSGKLAQGAGFTELSPGRFVIHSSADLTTWYTLATEPLVDYRASARMQVARGLGQDVVAMLQLAAVPAAELSPGDVVFGKSTAGLLLARFEGDRWTDIRVGPDFVAPPPGDLDHFEIVVRGGRYEFRLNGRLVAAWSRATPRADWTLIHAGRGSRVEIRDWSVERLRAP
jgi:hypothetical protein